MKTIDCYGRSPGDPAFHTREPLPPAASRSVGATTYVRYGAGGRGPIHRMECDDEGRVCVSWSWGALDAAASLVYHALEETLEVPA